MADGHKRPEGGSEQHALNSVVAAVAASHSRFAAPDVAEVLYLALEGAQLKPPSAEWISETAQNISDGSIVPITSNVGLDMTQLLESDS